MNRYQTSLNSEARAAIAARRAKIAAMVKTNTRKQIAETLGITVKMVENDLRAVGADPRRDMRGKPSQDGTRDHGRDVHGSYKGGAPSSDVTRPPKLRGAAPPSPPDSPDIALPKTVPSRFGGRKYDEADLLRYFAQAHRRGTMDAQICRHLGVTLDRLHYCRDGEGRAFLERAAGR